jgi:predicted aspartyl protease
MSKITEKLLLKNMFDVMEVQLGLKKEAEVREVTVSFVADTGAHYNTITEDVFEKLGLTKTGSRLCKLAGGIEKRFDISSQAEIWWRDRSIPMPFLVVPVGANNLFSVTAMELLDLMPDPMQGKLVGAHGDEYVCMLE